MNGAIATRIGDTARERTLTIEVLEHLFGDVRPRDFGFALWDGTTWGNTSAACTISLNHPGALRAMFLPPSDLTAGEAYLRGDFDVYGSMERAVELGLAIVDGRHSPASRIAVLARILRLPPARAADRTGGVRLDGTRHSRTRDADAVRYHYDVGNDFYALWLDGEMAYSCAYFHDPAQDLDSAQRAKFDHICKKLRLSPGDRLLDIGSGWGGLLCHAASHYGIEGVGITLSEEQARYAAQRVQTLGLDDRVAFKVRDYRDTADLGTFDKLVSVGMYEHVGAKRLPDYFAHAWSALRPGGLFLNHGISTATVGERVTSRSFTNRYIFPDGQLEAISEVLKAAEKTGFEIRDVESLREHYAMTLRHWVDRLERNAERATELTSDTVYRAWRLYMAGAASCFERGVISVFQTLLSRPNGGASELPLTRTHLYAR